jgi:hypothetical protein
MCTSFISRKNDVIIGMNFDNNGMAYSVDTKRHNWFVVNVDGGRGKYPSFGVNKNGLFFNNLVVDSNGKGHYRRPSKNVTHTTKLIGDLLNGTIKEEDLKDYLGRIEVVNTPDWSCHNMIIDSSANVYIVEPGRGNIFSPYKESDYYIMTNESIIDMQKNGNHAKCDRYKVVDKELNSIIDLQPKKAFEILQKAFQTDGEWKTELSMVFSKKEGKVYYCVSGDITKLREYTFLD